VLAQLSRDDAASLLTRIPTDILGKGDLAAIEEILDPAFVDHNPPMPGAPEGLDGVRHTVQMLRSGISNLTPDTLETVVEGSTVALRWEGSGRHDGTFMGLPPTGKDIHMAGIMIARIGDSGKITERWSQINMLSVMQELGLVPATSGVFRALVPSVVAGRATTPDENRELLGRYVEMWNAADGVDESLFHPQAVVPHVPVPMGAKGAQALVATYRTAFPDLRVSVEDTVAEGDLVAARLRKSGTHQGPLFAIPATGRSVNFEELIVLKVADGRILATWFEDDQMAMMQQLGLGVQPV
jgi:predicted ester cyclase